MYLTAAEGGGATKTISATAAAAQNGSPNDAVDADDVMAMLGEAASDEAALGGTFA